VKKVFNPMSRRLIFRVDDFATDVIAAQVGAMDVSEKTERSGVFA
jgi:hypothetical protein